MYKIRGTETRTEAGARQQENKAELYQKPANNNKKVLRLPIFFNYFKKLCFFPSYFGFYNFDVCNYLIILSPFKKMQHMFSLILPPGQFSLKVAIASV